ncbi:uncharacterized protein LOC128256657 [Drosophila gunungcola]|uniref:uncharacterized protein LOC128256657 n=1 Tax=Drosophila gunungcola TaxID=103775 RepID=UPI0022E17081|nr:uncharacterized protein LOC128256657 [Drosophila gunungcola]
MSFQKQLDDFNQKLDFAKWYMGVSTQQETAMYAMSESLRDDYEQGTGEQMFKSLVNLGVQPVISKKKISRIVQLSRNNILAFLYFVLEGYYKTCQKDGEYSINEQLLMNAIAKIDMMATIRALDTILPPHKPSKVEYQGQAANAPVAKYRAQKKTSKKLPYFQSQPKPVQRTSRLTTKLPDFVVSFNFWPNNAPPNYGKDEAEPWYAQYRLNPGQRLIKKTLSETLERYFKLEGLEERQEDEERPKSREPEPNMCLVHKGQVVQSQLLRDELAVKARDRCLELLDVTEPYGKIRRARIVAQLEHDIDVVMARHRNAMHCDQTKVLTIENFDCVLCQQMLVSQPWPDPMDQVGRALVGEECGMAHTAAIDTYRGKRLEGGGGKPKKNKKEKKGKKKEAVEVPPEPPKEEPKVSPWKPPPRKLFSGGFRMQSIDFNEKLEKCETVLSASECEVPPAPKRTAVSFLLAKGKIPTQGQQCAMRVSSKRYKKKFFRGPRVNKPYQFKYPRVFQSGQPRPFDLEKIVTKSLVKALDKSDEVVADEECDFDCLMSEMSIEEEVPMEAKPEGAPEGAPEAAAKVKPPTPPNLFDELDLLDPDQTTTDSEETLGRSSNHSRRSHVDHKAEIVEAVVRCAEAIWQKQATIKRAEMERLGRLTPRKALTYKDTDKIDPDNAEQMNQLLKDGLRALRKEPRFVLASLPEAHKLPILREWVKRRYGKTYSQKELEESIAESNRIFELVTVLQSSPPDPDLMGIDRLRRSEENFANYKKIKNKAFIVKQTYHELLNARYLGTVSSAWHAMGNYLVPGGPPRRTFFAYIASNPQEIMRAKVWNGEYRNCRAMREKRKEQESRLGKKQD